MGDEYTGTRVSMLNDREVDSLRKIVALLNGAVTGDAPLATTGGGGASGIPVTPHHVLLGASASQVIPVGAIGWSFVILSGTATVGAAANVPAGVGDSYQQELASSLTITTNSASSAYVSWNI